VARHGANWRRNWDRSRDHWWHGRRCHFHNNVWVIYEPFFWYPYSYGYGYYPYGSYYDGAYYEDAYATDQQEPAAYTDQGATEESGSQITAVQRALAREGYYDGPIDGQMGAGTRKALRRYQSDRGLEVTGGISRSVIESLRVR
jgi:hypothetical protein